MKITIRKRPSGFYELDYRWQGHRYRYNVSEVMKTANDAVTLIQAQVAAGTFKGPKRHKTGTGGISTFADMCSVFLEECQGNVDKGAMSPATVAMYRDLTKALRAECGEKRKMEITKAEDGKRTYVETWTGRSVPVVQIDTAYINDIFRRLVSRYGSTVRPNRCLSILKTMFAKIEDGSWAVPGVDRSPARSVKKLKEVERKVYPSAEEHDAIVAVAAPWLKPILEMAYATGARLGDLLGDQYGKEPLKWKNVRIDGDDPKVVYTATKEKQDRPVPLNSEAVAVLKRLRGNMIPMGTRAVFTRDGHPVDPSSISKALRSALKKAKITRPLTIHSWRHAFCTEVANAGVTLKDGMEMAGHKLAATHLKYQHQDNQEAKRAAVEMLTRRAPSVKEVEPVGHTDLIQHQVRVFNVVPARGFEPRT